MTQQKLCFCTSCGSEFVPDPFLEAIRQADDPEDESTTCKACFTAVMHNLRSGTLKTMLRTPAERLELTLADRAVLSEKKAEET